MWEIEARTELNHMGNMQLFKDWPDLERLSALQVSTQCPTSQPSFLRIFTVDQFTFYYSFSYKLTPVGTPQNDASTQTVRKINRAPLTKVRKANVLKNKRVLS